MTEETGKHNPPRVIVIADVESNAQSLIKRVLVPAGMQAWTETNKTPPCDVLIVDVTQLRGEAGERQVAGAKVGFTCNFGGFCNNVISMVFVREE